MFEPVFFDGTLPRYGFWRCVAWAFGVVVPSAGLIGRGVATEYPRGLSVCPQAVKLKAKAITKIFVFPALWVWMAVFQPCWAV